MNGAPRYAVYWVPARDHPLWSAGCTWLGRDPEDGARSLPRRDHTTEPRRYGFHATLEAPMRLRDGLSDARLLAAVATIAETTRPFAMPTLSVRKLARFVALRPVDATPIELQRLADRCVTDLDACRAAFTADEWTARSDGLDAADRALMRRWGYHFVFDRWRFHLTLSDSFPDGDADGGESALLDAARRHFAAALAVPLVANQIAVFVEQARGEPFRLARRFALTG